MGTTVTDEFMRKMLASTKTYCVMILRAGPNWDQAGANEIIWEHGRRNFELRAQGVLSIVCAVINGGDIKGIGIFKATMQETRDIMDRDPGVHAGIFVYETHLCRGFPGDSLPQ